MKFLLRFFSKFKRYISKKYLAEYVLAIVILEAIFFRFYNMPQRYGMDFDPTRDVIISQYGAENFLFPLVGPPSGIAPFSFGPWYYYQLIFAQIAIPSPFAPWIYVGILSVLSVIVMYFVGGVLGDKKLGIILAVLTALSPAELGPTTGLSNPNLIPLHASLSILFFLLFLKNKLNLWWVLSWGFIMGVGINDHFQATGLLVLPLVAFLYKRFPWRFVLSFICGLLVSFIPLIVFNIISDYQTIRGILFYISGEGNSLYIPNSWTIYLKDFWVSFWSYILGVPYQLGIILLIFSGVVGAKSLIDKKIEKSIILLFVAFLLNLIIWRFFEGERVYYYFIYLHPFIILFLGWAFWNSFKIKFLLPITLALAGVWIYFVLKEDAFRLQPETKYLEFQNQSEMIEKVGKDGYSIYLCGEREKHRAQALVFFLSNDDRFSPDGYKIGVRSDQCTDDSTLSQYSKEIGIYEINNFSDKELFEKGWEKITPQSVYEETVSGK